MTSDPVLLSGEHWCLMSMEHPKVIQGAFLIWIAGCFLLLEGCSGYRTTFMPTVAMTEEFTDNVRLSSEDPESDIISSVSPGFTLASASRSRDFTLHYSPSFTHYALTDTDMSLRHIATTTAVNRFSERSRLEFNDSFSRTDDPMVERRLELTRSDTPQPPQDDTRRDSREPYYSNFASFRYRHDLGADDYFTAGLSSNILRNEDPTVEDSTMTEPSLGLTYWFSPRYGIETLASFTRGDFSLDTNSFNEYVLSNRFMRRFEHNLDLFVRYVNTRMDFFGEEADYMVHDGTVGVDYHLSEATFFSLSTGYFIRDTDGETPETGYVLRGDMAKRFSRGAVRLSGGTGYQQTFFGAENLGFTQYYDAAIGGNYQLTQRLTASGQVTYTHNIYMDQADRKDDLIAVEASLQYVIGPWLTSTLRVAHRQLDSDEASEAYEENRVSLSFGLTPIRSWLLR
jgi:hypothetical protein